MKQIHPFLVVCVAAMLIISCRKEHNDVNAPSRATHSNWKGGSGSGGGSGGGGSTGALQGVLSGLASRHISGTNDSVLATFTQAAPAGWVLHVSSSNSAVQVPATIAVPPGVFGMYVPFTSTTVTNAINVTISVSLGSQTKSTTIKVFPVTTTFPAPALQSPSNGAKFKNRTIVTFTSNTNNNAYYYHLQISSVSNFSTTETDLLLDDPLWRQSAFSGFGTHYWRMRFVDAGGHGGPWSATRTFITQQ